MDKEYSIGLTVEDNAIGWSVIDESQHLIKRKKKNMWGVYLFSTSQLGKERREFRQTRRLYRRKSYRLSLLEEIFKEEISVIDVAFFKRMNLSFYQKNISLFQDDMYDDQDYFKQYPTIYHLRKELVDQPEKKDLRLIYLAIHHLIKYRGHFYQENLSAELLATGFISGMKEIDRFLLVKGLTDKLFSLQKLQQLNDLLVLAVPVTKKLSQIEQILVDEPNRFIWSEIFQLILPTDVSIDSLTSEMTRTLGQLLLMNDSVLQQQVIMEELDEETFLMVQTIKKMRTLVQITPHVDLSKTTSDAIVSSQMVSSFEKHKKDLNKLKTLLRSLESKLSYQRMFHPNDRLNNYYHYIESPGKTSQSLFYQFIKDELQSVSTHPLKGYILSEIDEGNFLPKQRSIHNKKIPYQIQLYELQRILDNQAFHYPFLEKNKEKILRLLSFRIPYYIGPLTVDREKSPYSWLVKKEGKDTLPITPWNFEKVVDLQSSATQFVNKKRKRCLYFKNRRVLPKESICYQEYQLLNEWNELDITTQKNGEKKTIKLSLKMKQDMMTELFMTQKSVSYRELSIWLINYLNVEQVDIVNHVTPNKRKFTGSLLSTQLYQKILGKDFRTNMSMTQIEDMILWQTVFSDRQLLIRKLESMDCLSSEQIEQLSLLRFQGWGDVSSELLTHRVSSGNTVMTLLWKTSQTLPKIVQQNDVEQEIPNDNKQRVSYSLVKELQLPQVKKKQVWQSIKVIQDIEKVMGHSPRAIYLTCQTDDCSESLAALLKKHYSSQETQPIIDFVYKERLNEFRMEHFFPRGPHINDYHYAQDSYLVNIFGKNALHSTEHVQQYFEDNNHLESVKKVCHYKQCNVVKEVKEVSGELFKETIYPKSHVKAKIPIKRDLNPAQYGGRSQMTCAYSSLIKIVFRTNRYSYRFIRVSVEDTINISNNQLTLKHVIDRELYAMNIKNIAYYDVLHEKVRQHQRVVVDGKDGYLSSYQEIYNARQLIISQPSHNVCVLSEKVTLSAAETSWLETHIDEAFEEIIDKINKEYVIYNNLQQKLMIWRHKFYEHNLRNKRLIIKELLVLTRATTETGNLKLVEGATRVGRTPIAGMKEVTVYHQSVTGLFEKKDSFF